MGFFGGLTSGIKSSIEKSSIRKAKEKEIRREVALHEDLEFEKEFRKSLKEVALANAKRRAEKLSGAEKLKAMKRLRGLENQRDSKPGFFSRVGEMAERNKQRTAKNLKATAERNKEIQKMKSSKTIRDVRKPFGGGTGETRKPFGGNR